MSTTRIKPQSINDNVINSSMARQSIINGNFDIWQRGVSVSVATGSPFLADRWFDAVNADGGTLPTLVRSREALTSGDIYNSFYYSRLTTNGAGSGFGNDCRHPYLQRIENGTKLLCGNGKKVTLSFWARSSIANKKIGIFLQQNYGSGGTPSDTEIINGTNFTLTSSWVKYTHTFTTNTLAGKTFGTVNDDRLELFFYYLWGSTRQSYVGAASAETYVGSGTIDIAQVQLCAGDVALPFMPKSFEEELRACQRYCLDISAGDTQNYITYGTVYASTTTNAYWNYNLPVEMRIPPSLVAVTASQFSLGYANTTNIALTAFSINLATKRNILFQLTVAAGLTADRPGSLYASAAGKPILITAEL